MNSLIAGALIAGLAMSSTPASIDPDAGLDTIQTRADRATEERIRAIDSALNRLDGADSLTDDHRVSIVETLTADRAAMEELQAQIAAETDRGNALDAYQSIFTDYRVFAVSIPQALYTVGADRLTEVALPRLERAYDGLATISDDTEALAELRAAIDQATDLAGGIADAALAVEPSDYNDNSTVLAELRLKLREAAAATRDAASAARDLWNEER
ncbi:MAG: hypothetical protein K2X36_08675 [Microbacteriaceae bacterium]|nr:hypothetical protein [Microbacteriaceae bacterium]